MTNTQKLRKNRLVQVKQPLNNKKKVFVDHGEAIEDFSPCRYGWPANVLTKSVQNCINMKKTEKII